MYIPQEPEKSAFRLERKVSRIDDRRLRKLVRINAIQTNWQSSIPVALAKAPNADFSGYFGILQNIGISCIQRYQKDEIEGEGLTENSLISLIAIK